MPKQGDVVFFKSNGNLVGRLIDFFTKSKCDIVHVAIYVDGDKTIETNLNKSVDYATISKYKTKYHIRECYGITDEQRDRVIEYCESHFGEPYDLVQIFDIVLKWFGIDLRYRPKNRKICSTLVWNAYNYAGIQLTKHDDCTPDDLFNSEKFNQSDCEC